MNQYCPNSNNCTESPIGNFTSEEPDREVFIARNYGEQMTPPLGENWRAVSCIGTFISAISQEDADARAQQANLECLSVLWPEEEPDPDNPNDPTITPRVIYQNSEQSCSFTCPDGQVFTYTIPAGTVYAFSQAAADTQARSLACNRATSRRICIGELTNPGCCVGEDYEGVVTFSTPQTGPFSATVVTGVLPPGLSITNDASSFTISGNPTTAGQYDFTVWVTGETGSIQKAFTIYAVELQPDTLTSGTEGNAYNDTVTVLGPTLGTVVWSVSDGALPDGLSLDSGTGQITGTPTLAGTFTFTITMTDDR